MLAKNIRVEVNPDISPDQLWDFYVRNGICEVGFGKKKAVVPLKHSSLIVGALDGERLAGFARAMFDGLTGVIMEFCLELELQGSDLVYENGSLVEKDKSGIGREMGEVMVDHLRRMGASFISLYIVANCEEKFYQRLGFIENTGHLVYYIDERPYV